MIGGDNTANDLLKQVLIIWSFIGPAIGWFLGFRLSKSQHKRQKLSGDVAKFCVPFEKSLSDLKAGKQTAGTIKGHTKEHLFAKDIFRRKLEIAKSKKVLRGFDKVWNE